MSVNWRRLDAEDRIRLEWVEREGPPVQSPKHRGFGFLVITELAAQALQAAAKIDFSTDGVRWQLDFPTSHVLATSKHETLT